MTEGGHGSVDASRFLECGRALLSAVVPIRVTSYSKGFDSGDLEPIITNVQSTGVRITPALVLTSRFLEPGDDLVSSVTIGTETAEHVWSDPGGLTLFRTGPSDGSLPELSLASAMAGEIMLVSVRTSTETQISFGRLLDGQTHDAFREAGATGAPIFDTAWALVGLHRGRGADGKTGTFVPTAMLVRALEHSPCWDEIASTHRLVRSSVGEAVAISASPELERAVTWDPDDDHPLSERERRRARHGATLEQLRKARGDTPARSPEQRAIDRILAGPPYTLDALADDELLPFATAARWFRDVAPGLPEGAELERAIHRRRRLAALDAIIGPRFAPRTEELAHLKAWLATPERPPLVVRGPGGIGKSALLAAFIREVCPPSRFAWVDFDRPDVSADEPSITRVVDEHLAWQTGDGPLIVVLDSFETSVQTYGYAALNPALDALARRFPDLGVVVGTRTPVPLLEVEDQPAVECELAGLDPAVATRWLLEEGIPASIAAEVAAVTHGVPLNLRLARELLKGKSEGEARALLAELPKQLVTGYLYRRVLRRLNDETLKQQAQWAMVPRRLVPELLAAVLGAPADDAGRLFESLRKEVTLLEGETVLIVRPDLRNMLLPLLEADDPARVRAIDALAAEHWSRRAAGDTAAAAEAVYHLLRLGELARAEQAWSPGAASHLRGYAIDEMPAASRSWLQSRVAQDSVEDRVEDLLARGQLSAARATLADAPYGVSHGAVAASRGARRRRLLGFLNEAPISEATPASARPDIDMDIEGLESIVLPQLRPALRIRNGALAPADASLPWMFLQESGPRAWLEHALAAVGRLELARDKHFLGSATLVGEKLFLTARNAVSSIAAGMGQDVRLLAEQRAQIDLRAEGEGPGEVFAVSRVVLVHPYWDIAILEVESPPGPTPLALATSKPAKDANIVVIGHPGEREVAPDLVTLITALYEGVLGVKRLMPGRYRGEQPTLSWGRSVMAAQDDSATLSQDAGAAVIDPATGAMLGVRFDSSYPKGNSFVPAWELARDPEIQRAGVLLAGTPASPPDWISAWGVGVTPRHHLLDAYMAWQEQDLARMRNILDVVRTSVEPETPSQIDLELLEAAYLIRRDLDPGDRDLAGEVLQKLVDTTRTDSWSELDRNATIATRIRLVVDADAEHAFLSVLDEQPDLAGLLTPTSFRVFAPPSGELPWSRHVVLMTAAIASKDRRPVEALGFPPDAVLAAERILAANGKCVSLERWLMRFGQRILDIPRDRWTPSIAEAREMIAALVGVPHHLSERFNAFLLEKLDLVPHPTRGWAPIVEPLLRMLRSSARLPDDLGTREALTQYLEHNARTGRLGAYLTKLIRVDSEVAWAAGLLHVLTPLPIEAMLKRRLTSEKDHASPDR